ncbi:hypothetical protein L1987_02445 [Smallanthus sonchifolius]|uniref:Uncharacterized protein n=1 Tax=Smallanthus sonchifolius TaxID=185202 RepID=A0ACB9K7S5_9ASTR|nr:hypothetical protein L1987_02445 [Smallanthus sonchifolius]
MTITNRRHQQRENRRRLRLRKHSSVLRDAVEKVRRVTEVNNHVKIILLLIETMDLDDVRVSAKDVEDFRFFLKALAASVVRKEAFAELFTGKRVAGDGGVTTVDDSEADFLVDLYKSKKGVTLLSYAVWVRNESLVFEINQTPGDENVEKGRGMGQIQVVESVDCGVY